MPPGLSVTVSEFFSGEGVLRMGSIAWRDCEHPPPLSNSHQNSGPFWRHTGWGETTHKIKKEGTVKPMVPEKVVPSRGRGWTRGWDEGGGGRTRQWSGPHRRGTESTVRWSVRQNARRVPEQRGKRVKLAAGVRIGAEMTVGAGVNRNANPSAHVRLSTSRNNIF